LRAAPLELILPGLRLGNVVIEVAGLEKEYGDKVLFKDLKLKLPPDASSAWARR
jgi:ATPase subunit of ABC transporter with duplicated ATPase domains